ncbi:DnaB-like helicase N-terminal domain-containing protein [Mesorhizobium sp. B2-1-2]|uniref:replicative DNA helicase n=1 Tax=Mesorhizobium sp. B2-1-2 TaxID=2589973 RepID=UPI0011288909|nr:DnaB-like helicase N-terminal domain-containing protein [Mesorhizobium sp. B2-1-2]TPN11698.1 helicase DnaB [Mesorhizobium sp. B2-1-2]
MNDKLRELPSNIEAEQGLLGAILIDNRTFDRVASFLEEEHFFEPLHQRIYLVCGELIRMGKAATPITVKSFLPSKTKIGDMSVVQYLVTMASAAVGTLTVRDFGIAIHEAWLAREAISAASHFLDFAYAPPPGVDVIGERTDLEDRLAQLRGLRVKSESRRGAGARYLDNMEAIKERGSVVGVPIALKEIQRVISEPSFESGNYYGLLSSSGEGKTSLMVQIVYHALAAGCAVQIQSYDQTAEQFVRQMIAQHHKIEARRQRFADLSDSEWTDARKFADWLDTQPFEVKDCTQESAPSLVSYARAFKRRHGDERQVLIVTDYVNAIEPEKRTFTSDEGTKAAAINSILKAGAKSIGVAWLALNQRNTKGLQRDNPRPIAADLFGGEGARRGYDAIFYLYRFKKFYEERKAIASTDRDWKVIEKVFPSAVREDKDVADLGALKVRFGDPYLRESLDFNARFTLLESIEQPTEVDQEEMSFLQGMG